MTTKTKWVIDAGHSDIQFKVKHLMISTITGAFKTFSGELNTGTDDFKNAEVKVEIDSKSIFTNNTERDSHLQSPLFLNSQKFPKITFTGIIEKKDDNFTLHGDVIICNVIKKINMSVEYTGTGKGRFNETRAGFEVSGEINRKDFGLDFNLLTDTGSMVVGEEIKLNFNIEVIQETTSN